MSTHERLDIYERFAIDEAVAKEAEKQARTSLRLPAELYKQARILALERNVTFQELVETLLRDELSRAGALREPSAPGKARR